MSMIAVRTVPGHRSRLAAPIPFDELDLDGAAAMRARELERDFDRHTGEAAF